MKKFLYAVSPASAFGEVERALPLATDMGRDLPAVVVRRSSSRSTSRCRRCRRARSPWSPACRPSFRAAAVNSARLVGHLDPRLLEEVGPVRDDARARVVRDAVQLAAVAAGRSKTVEPGRSSSGTSSSLSDLERPGGHVLRHLGVAHLDDVRCAPARERRVELLEVVPPGLVLDVDGDAGMLASRTRALAAFTIGAQLADWASVWSQTVMLLVAASSRRRDRSERGQPRRPRPYGSMRAS